MSWPAWRVCPARAQRLTDGQLICAAIITIIGLPVLGFTGAIHFTEFISIKAELDGPFSLLGYTFAVLVFSLPGSWFYFIVAAPLIGAGIRSGYIGYGPTAITGGGLGFSITFLVALFLPIEFQDALLTALFCTYIGALFSLTFWLLVRLINPSAFQGTSKPETVGDPAK